MAEEVVAGVAAATTGTVAGDDPGTVPQMTARRISVLLLTGFLLTSCTTAVYQPETTPVALVTFSQGFPSVSRNSRPYILAEQSKIFPNDMVTTDEQSRVHLRMASGTLLKLGTYSQLFLAGFTQSDNSLILLNLASGSLEIERTASIRHRVRIGTALADIETETSKLWMAYDASTRNIHIVSLGFEDIRVTNRHGSVTLSAPLQMTTVSPGAAPQAILEWSQARFTTVRDHYNRISR